jgi:hypothetical protein
MDRLRFQELSKSPSELVRVFAQVCEGLSNDSSILDSIEEPVPAVFDYEPSQRLCENRRHFWKLLQQLNRSINQEKKSIARAFLSILQLVVSLLKIRFGPSRPNNGPHA